MSGVSGYATGCPVVFARSASLSTMYERDRLYSGSPLFSVLSSTTLYTMNHHRMGTFTFNVLSWIYLVCFGTSGFSASVSLGDDFPVIAQHTGVSVCPRVSAYTRALLLPSQFYFVFVMYLRVRERYWECVLTRSVC